MKLYQLADAFQQVSALIEQGGEGLEDTLESIEMAFEEKVENCILAYRNLIGQRDMCKAEAHRLSERARALEKQAEALKRYVENEMKRVGKEKVKTALFDVSLVMNPPSVHVVDEKQIPTEYWRQPDPVLAKDRILDAFKAGYFIPGVEIRQEKSLRIR